MNIDGIQVFTSSKFTLWPILLSITKSPPHLRMNKYYILLAGVWFGPQHTVGLDISTPDGRKQIRMKILLTGESKYEASADGL